MTQDHPVTFITNIKELVTVDESRITADNPLGIIRDGAVAIQDGKITWVGKTSELSSTGNAKLISANGAIVTPGLIDSHTHPVFAGNRAHEFEMRLQGKSYLEIAEAGGGIACTVESTRNATEEELYQLAKPRLERMVTFGVTTVEAKSGYGLNWDSELKSLNVINRLKNELPMGVVTTYMGAHDIPPEYKDKTDDYVRLVCEEQIPKVAEDNLADCCDVFCEKGYFDIDQSRKILLTAKEHGLKIKIHAEEFNDLGGAKLAAEVGCLSADHLLHISDEGIASLKEKNVVATLLPGTAFYLRVDYAPARKILEAGCDVAIATDFNPGSCMSENLQLTMTLACLQMKMLPYEVIKSVTINGAKALGLDHDRGSVANDKRADLVFWKADSYHELLYHFGVNLVDKVFIEGTQVI